MLNLRGSVLDMEPRRAETLCEWIAARSQAPADRRSGFFAPTSPQGCLEGGDGFELVGRAAVVRVNAPVFLADMDAMEAWWFGVMPTGCLVNAIDNAAASGAEELVLDMDCPGGTHAGIDEVVNAIGRAQAAGMKVTAVARPLMTSAAFWFGMVADEVVGTPGSLIGSIGSISVLWDTSKAFDAAGIKVHAIASGRLKRTGTPGTAIESKDLEYLQGLIDDAAGDFFAAVSEARGIPVDAVKGFDAAVFDAKRALANGLIDRIESFDAVLARAAGTKTTPYPGDSEPTTMPLKPDDFKSLTIADLEANAPQIADHYRKAAAPSPATLDELKAAFKGESDFIVDSLDKKRTMPQAHEAFATTLRGRIEALNATVAARDATIAERDGRIKDLEKVGAEGKGLAAPAGGERAEDKGAASALSAAIQAIMVRDKVKHPVAHDTARLEHPELYKAWREAGYPKLD